MLFFKLDMEQKQKKIMEENAREFEKVPIIGFFYKSQEMV